MADAPAHETIRVDTTDGVATITLNRPDSLNALNATMRRELLAALKAAGRDEAVRAVVITGEGRGFCSGADLRGGEGERRFRRVLTAEYNPLIRAIRDLPKPVIAAVNGVAAGAGVSLALACDLVYAAEEARFIQAFVRIALVPDSGSTRTLVRALGRHRAAQLIFTGEPLPAAEAQAAGLVNRVVPGAELASTVHEAARALAAGPTRAIGYAKRLINAAEDASLDESLALEADLQELAGRTEDHAEGVAAFTEKREPRFIGR
ncbi:MAG TPA: enoyl-CoA hydratase-related protein [candidate division Zixibacteria bacterium]|nr:enoyl-CoA hydratase-related protein [candidate division Zixibacteria bacterium]